MIKGILAALIVLAVILYLAIPDLKDESITDFNNNNTNSVSSPKKKDKKSTAQDGNTQEAEESVEVADAWYSDLKYKHAFIVTIVFCSILILVFWRW